MTNKKNVTEIFITHVKPGEYNLYKEWALKTQELEKAFPGYLGTDIQSPSGENNHDWVTVLHFDTAENLDNWMKSKEREKIIEESEGFIEECKTYRFSPFSGWFPNTSKKKSLLFKETMLVLLVLYPIVMLEFRFLMPHLGHLNPPLATFISNALSVTLITWPMMPICLYFLKWWLSPDIAEKNPSKNILGYIIVLTLYALEILAFNL